MIWGLLVALGLALSAAPASAEPLMGRASVIDGDTIEIHGERIRIEGIDAPESRQTCTDRDTGAEVRFLRVEMDLSQRNLAAIIGTEEQNVFRWEKSRKKEIPGPADRLLRGLYSEYAGGDGSIRRMCERLSDLDQIESPVLKVVDTEHGWDVECAA